MKIHIQNLGAIKQADIDLKPLTVFIGPNNAGKTWAAYLIDAIFGSFGREKYIQAYLDQKVQPYPELDTMIQAAVEGEAASLDLVQFADTHGERFFNEIASLAPQWMNEFLNTARASFSNFQARIELAQQKTEFLDRIWKRSLRQEINTPMGVFQLIKEADNGIFYYLHMQSKSNVPNGLANVSLHQQLIREYIIKAIFGYMAEAIFENVTPFPTERSTFVILRQAQAMFPDKWLYKRTHDSLIVARPVEEFLRKYNYILTYISVLERGTFDERANLVEKDILNGSLSFSTPEPDPSRELLFHPTEEVSLEMPIASSMVKELSALVSYLRYLARPGELIIIDEPEMNLHPEAQVKLMEFLAILVNSGLNVLFTTHSPYMVDHLANLIKAASFDDKESVKNKFYLKRSDAFISQDKVSVYLFDKGQAKNILKRDGQIDWSTFAKVSDRVSEIYFELEESKDAAKKSD